MVWGPPTGRLERARRDVDARRAASPVEWLLAHALLVATDTASVVLPREVALHLRGGRVHEAAEPELPAPATSPVDPDHVDRAAAGAAAETVRLVEELLELWSAEPPKVLRTGGVGVRERTRAAGALDVDETRLALLVETAHAAGLLAAGDDGRDVSELWLPTPAYDGWRTSRWPTAGWSWPGPGWPRPASPDWWAARTSAAARCPRSAPTWTAPSPPPSGRPCWPTSPGCRSATATTTESLSARLRWQAPRRGGRLQDDLVTWTVEEARTLGLATGGALAGHGRRLAAGDGPGAVKALEAAAAAAARPRAAAGRPDRRGARPAGAGPGPVAAAGRRRRVDRWRDRLPLHRVHGPAGARRRLDGGRRVRACCARHSRTPVPQPLTYLVDDVARRHGRVRVGAASSFVRCDDESTLGGSC